MQSLTNETTNIGEIDQGLFGGIYTAHIFGPHRKHQEFSSSFEKTGLSSVRFPGGGFAEQDPVNHTLSNIYDTHDAGDGTTRGFLEAFSLAEENNGRFTLIVPTLRYARQPDDPSAFSANMRATPLENDDSVYHAWSDSKIEELIGMRDDEIRNWLIENNAEGELHVWDFLTDLHDPATPAGEIYSRGGIKEVVLEMGNEFNLLDIFSQDPAAYGEISNALLSVISVYQAKNPDPAIKTAVQTGQYTFYGKADGEQTWTQKQSDEMIRGEISDINLINLDMVSSHLLFANDEEAIAIDENWVDKTQRFADRVDDWQVARLEVDPKSVDLEVYVSAWNSGGKPLNSDMSVERVEELMTQADFGTSGAGSTIQIFSTMMLEGVDEADVWGIAVSAASFYESASPTLDADGQRIFTPKAATLNLLSEIMISPGNDVHVIDSLNGSQVSAENTKDETGEFFGFVVGDRVEILIVTPLEGEVQMALSLPKDFDIKLLDIDLLAFEQLEFEANVDRFGVSEETWLQIDDSLEARAFVNAKRLSGEEALSSMELTNDGGEIALSSVAPGSIVRLSLEKPENYFDFEVEEPALLLPDEPLPIIGTQSGDILKGDAEENALYGKGGDDRLEGFAGDDILRGNKGADTILGGKGSDEIGAGLGDDRAFGNLGDDFIYGYGGNDLLRGDDGDDNLYGGRGNDTLHGGSGNDFLKGEGGNDILKGAGGDDILDGGIGDDFIFGGEGSDFLKGGLWSDHLYGDEGDDTLEGNNGSDFLAGGMGNDQLIGGRGKDIFSVGMGSDRIMDFEIGRDTLVFEGLDDDRLVADQVSMAQSGNDLVFVSEHGNVTLHDVIEDPETEQDLSDFF